MEKIKIKIQKAIINKSLIQFYYSDKSKPTKGIRQIEPYLFGVKEGSYFISGYDTDPDVQRESRQKNYLLSQIDLNSFKILKDHYSTLKVHPDKIYRTTKTIIICVADFPEKIAEYF